MWKEYIKQGYYVQITFKDGLIESISSNVFSQVTIKVNNFAKIGNDDFQEFAIKKSKEIAKERENKKNILREKLIAIQKKYKINLGY